jgi:Fe-S-cluster-containing dehydrogenase component/DMSO reductase anchor subunit
MPNIAPEIQKKGFIFDQNKCVGCQACVVACQIENKTELPYNWRKVQSSAESHQSGVPLFYLSLACNHCEEAPCLKACPTQAYYRDPETNVVLIDSRKCIACNYCSWVCPYDAPVLSQGVMQKCSLCTHKLRENEKPSCAQNCPVGALDYGETDTENTMAPGFPDLGIRPRIQLTPLRIERYLPESDLACVQAADAEIIRTKEVVKQKIKLKDEWPLALFSFSIAVLVSYYFACLARNLSFQPLPFFALAIVALFFSLFHLGNPIQAFRSVYNIRSSWLSREIVFFTLFIGIMAFGYFSSVQSIFLLIASIVLGILSLLSADMIYRKTARVKKTRFHTGEILFIALFLFLISFPDLLIICVILKNTIYLIRKFFISTQDQSKLLNFTVVKLFFAIVIPAVFYSINQEVLLFSILISELIDRMEFYNDLEIISPEKTIRKSP